MEHELILYTTHCPKCNILAKRLDDLNLCYQVVSDEEIMIAKGLFTSPALEVQGKILNFIQAIQWVDSQGGNR